MDEAVCWRRAPSRVDRVASAAALPGLHVIGRLNDEELWYV
jgi:hypothetical protein